MEIDDDYSHYLPWNNDAQKQISYAQQAKQISYAQQASDNWLF